MILKAGRYNRLIRATVTSKPLCLQVGILNSNTAACKFIPSLMALAHFRNLGWRLKNMSTAKIKRAETSIC